ncbi:MAG: (deoxy)nucleoside triphosphate pyrophosphohydrolase [Saprospiraceae bacterium]|nr:(deoxy)nucleoside triphosphate pyrophosphohydrolase [Saprospiraceae bacterium]
MKSSSGLAPIFMIQVTCAIIESDKGVLCAQRSTSMSHPGKWEFPGGKVEEGESEEECLIREIREELAVEINILEALASHAHTYENGFSLVLIPFRCQIQSGVIRAVQHAEVRWVPRSELIFLDWVGADIPILQAYLERAHVK